MANGLSESEKQQFEGLLGQAWTLVMHEENFGRAQFMLAEIQKMLATKLPRPDPAIRPKVRGPVGADGQPPKSQRGEGSGTKKTAKKRT